MPTSTPPPYFPQNTLSPGDERTRRRIKFALFGCLFLVVVALVGVVWGVFHLIGTAR
ncbi:MAG TPA: hypothetical protein VF666_01220 [Pyrinomonadaceae bacterium]